MEGSVCAEKLAPKVGKGSEREVQIGHVFLAPGCKFDFPILFVEMLRSGIGLEACLDWYFVDTLHVLRALDSDLTGGCVKLQCLRTRLQACDSSLQAHRALDGRVEIQILRYLCIWESFFFFPQDDCFALRGVIGHLAAVLGVSAHELLAPVCFSLDKRTTLVALSCMM